MAVCASDDYLDGEKAGIAAERERCLKIVNGAKYTDPSVGSPEDAWNDACDHIADGIRGSGH